MSLKKHTAFLKKNQQENVGYEVPQFLCNLNENANLASKRKIDSNLLHTENSKLNLPRNRVFTIGKNFTFLDTRAIINYEKISFNIYVARARCWLFEKRRTHN